MDIKRICWDADENVFAELSALDKLCIGAEGWSAEAFREEAALPEGIVLAAFCGDAPVGLFAGFTAGDTGEVLTVATAPEHRGKGIARALLTEFLRLVPDGTETIALEVRQSNAPAIALYRSLGFERAGVRKRFYSAPDEDADVMVLNLKRE